MAEEVKMEKHVNTQDQKLPKERYGAQQKNSATVLHRIKNKYEELENGTLHIQHMMIKIPLLYFAKVKIS
jgi:NADH:ubiquinone oxidoreductase subunit E